MTEKTPASHDPRQDFKTRKLGHTANREYKYTYEFYFIWLYNKNMG